jgi:hypothetical protein
MQACGSHFQAPKSPKAKALSPPSPFMFKKVLNITKSISIRRWGGSKPFRTVNFVLRFVMIIKSMNFELKFY